MTVVQDKSVCQVKDLGLVGYKEAYDIQRDHVQALIGGGDQALLVCEHPPTLTLGRVADEKHLLVSREELAARGIGIHHVDRGGDITLHAPGQLVIYPILDLNLHGKDLHAYIRRLEKVIIDFLGGFDIVAERSPGETGVWIGRNKIASIGIGVRKWITYHGMAVNINTDLELFNLIKPCGLDVQMVSMAGILGSEMAMKVVKARFIESFAREFDLIFDEA